MVGRRIRLTLFVLALGAFAWCAETRGAYLEVPAAAEPFEILRRVQTRTGSLLPAQSYPQGESGIGAYLGQARITPGDSLQADFALRGRRTTLVRWSDTARGNSLALSPAAVLGFRTDDSSGSTGWAGLVGMGAAIYGKLGPRLSYFTDASIFVERTGEAVFTHQFNPEFGETYSVEKGLGDSLLDTRTYNRFQYSIIADLPWVVIKAGRDRIHTGPGYFSSLIATRDTPPYYLLEARVDFAPWLSLDNFLIRMTDTDHEIRKFANIHRFEFRLGRSLAIAFQDIVIYQDRDPDWRYLLPLVPLTFTESAMGGPDNPAMGFDFLWAAVPNLSLWGEVMIDDLMGPVAFFDPFWENRWAALAGFQVTSPFPGWDADLVLEFSRVEPWTYNGRQPQTGFKHFNVPSASRLGPDSRTWDMQLTYRPFPWMEVRQRLDFTDKGRGRPSTLGTVHDDAIDGLTKEFLGGDVESRRVWGSEVVLLRGQWLRVSAGWSRDFGDAERDEYRASLHFRL